MIQAVMTEPGKILFHDVPVPEVKPDQIKVKMKKIGVAFKDYLSAYELIDKQKDKAMKVIIDMKEEEKRS